VTKGHVNWKQISAVIFALLLLSELALSNAWYSRVITAADTGDVSYHLVRYFPDKHATPQGYISVKCGDGSRWNGLTIMAYWPDGPGDLNADDTILLYQFDDESVETVDTGDNAEKDRFWISYGDELSFVKKMASHKVLTLTAVANGKSDQWRINLFRFEAEYERTCIHFPI